MEADLHAAKAELHQALAREKPAQRNRAVLSKARHIRQGDLTNARHARNKSDTISERRRKAGNSQKEPEAKQTQRGQKAKKNNGIVYADGSGVGMQAENIVRMQEEEDMSKSIMYRMYHQGSRREHHLLRARGICVGCLGFEFMYKVLCNGKALCFNDEIRPGGDRNPCKITRKFSSARC